MDDKKDMTNNELRIFFKGEFQSVRKDLDDVKERLKKIENEIHALGNGKPGIAYRVADLENELKNAKENKKNRISWVIVLSGWGIALLSALIGSVLGPLITHWF